MDDFFVSMPPQAILCGLQIFVCPRPGDRVRALASVGNAGAAKPRGVKNLNFHYDKGDDGRRKNDTPPENGSAHAPRGKKKSATPEIGGALRSAYQQMVDEDIPPEMLDLLGKLG